MSLIDKLAKNINKINNIFLYCSKDYGYVVFLDNNIKIYIVSDPQIMLFRGPKYIYNSDYSITQSFVITHEGEILK